MDYTEALRAQGMLHPPLVPPAACDKCERPYISPYARCYECARQHGPALEAVRAFTYAALGTSAWNVLRIAKFQDREDELVSNCEGAVAAGLCETITTWAPEVVSPTDDGWVAVIVPSSHGLVIRAIERMHAEGWPTPGLVEGALAADPARPKQSEIDGREARRAAAAGKYKADSGAVAERRVVLIDDVYTGGDTMNDAARAMKEVGAASVYGVVYARRIFPDAMARYREEEGGE